MLTMDQLFVYNLKVLTQFSQLPYLDYSHLYDRVERDINPERLIIPKITKDPRSKL